MNLEQEIEIKATTINSSDKIDKATAKLLSEIKSLFEP